MVHVKLITALAFAATVTAAGCNRAQPAPEATTDAAREADERLKERIDGTAELEKRVVDLERRWTEMQTEVKTEKRAPTAALVDEVKEDVANVREAVANLKTTSEANWWERHEQATARTLDDIDADVQRFAKGGPATVTTTESDKATATTGFDLRRDDFVTKARARLDAMEERLKDVKADGARQTELEDTRARINKLQDDVDRLRSVSADDWWDISHERVEEYVDRVERSISRLNDDAKP
jgi:flagellin-like hook-associated protein FlgL